MHLRSAIPIHYAHNAAVLGPQAGEEFAQAIAELSPATAVQLLTPGETTTIGG